VGHEHLVAELDQPLELERLDLLGAWPAALEVPRTVDADVRGALEHEIVTQQRLDQPAVARLVGVGLARELQNGHGKT
jgi:hypothetical protein